MPEIGSISTSQSGVDFVIEWKIDNFYTLLWRNDAWYWSPDFSFGSERWELDIFPNGSKRNGSSGHVDLGLWKRYSDRFITQSFSFFLKTAREEKYNEKHFVEDFDNEDRFHGFKRFISRSELIKRKFELMPEGVLTVVCTMKSSTSVGSDSNIASASDKCCHCKAVFNTENLTSQQKKYMHPSTKCPNCLEIAFLQKLADEFESQKNRSEAGKILEQNSENTCVKACILTQEENAENSEKIFLELCTQMGKENGEGFKEKCLCRNLCVDASTQTEEQNVSLINLSEEYNLMTDVKDLWKEGRSIDVTFKVETLSGKTEFFAHQLIMALRSPYFADLFYGQKRNKGHQIIPVKGINIKAFEQMIRHCYDYQPCLKTIEDACALFQVAFQFKVTSLQKLCHTFIKDSKTEPGNVFCILKISKEIGDKSLEDMCYKILQERTREVVAAYELRDVTPFMVYTILDLPTLSLNSEYELIKWLFDWAQVKSGDKDSSFENAREYLEKLLQDMNFLALTFEEFAMLCRDYQDFFNSDEIASVSLNIAFPGTREMPDWYDKDLNCRVYTGSEE